MAEELWTVIKVLKWTQQRFHERGLASPRLDAELLLAEVLGLDRVSLYVRYDQPLAPKELAAYRTLIKRRLAGEPVAYLLGRKEFWSLPLHVDPRVLVPRPETEDVVQAVLELVDGRPGARLADIGTGSGAIALALAHERPDLEVLAVDRSAAALEVARKNAAACQVRVEFFEGDLCKPLFGRGPLDAIAANLPYIPEDDFTQLPADVRSEPRSALVGGRDGLDLIRRLLNEAPALLSDKGALVLEIGAGQAGSVRKLAAEAGYSAVNLRRDLAGIERVVVAQR